jgi:hypothetical protein
LSPNFCIALFLSRSASHHALNRGNRRFNYILTSGRRLVLTKSAQTGDFAACDASEGSPAIESHWGGPGGGVRGVAKSRHPLIYLVGPIGFGLLLVLDTGSIK